MKSRLLHVPSPFMGKKVKGPLYFKAKGETILSPFFLPLVVPGARNPWFSWIRPPFIFIQSCHLRFRNILRFSKFHYACFFLK